jgi:hypothetical protein
MVHLCLISRLEQKHFDRGLLVQSFPKTLSQRRIFFFATNLREKSKMKMRNIHTPESLEIG